MKKNNFELSVFRTRVRTSFVVSLITMAMVLLLLGIFAMIIFAGQNLINYAKENAEIQVYIHDNIDEGRAIKLKKEWETYPFIREIRYTSKETAAKLFLAETGEDFARILDINPLKASLSLRIVYSHVNRDSMKNILGILSDKSEVFEIVHHTTLIEKINENLKIFWTAAVGLSIMIVLISFVVIQNTIRLAIYAKRFIIRSMQLIGATDAFIKKPFLLSGMLQGFYASLIACILLKTAFYLLAERIPKIKILTNENMFLFIFAGTITTGVILGLVGSYRAVSRYLNIESEKLFE